MSINISHTLGTSFYMIETKKKQFGTLKLWHKDEFFFSQKKFQIWPPIRFISQNDPLSIFVGFFLSFSSFPPFETAGMSRHSDTCQILTGMQVWLLFFFNFFGHYRHFKWRDWIFNFFFVFFFFWTTYIH